MLPLRSACELAPWLSSMTAESTAQLSVACTCRLHLLG